MTKLDPDNDRLAKTVGQLVGERPGRARVFEHHGIDFCCGGKKTLAEASLEHHIDPAALLTELRAVDADPAVDQDDWTHKPIGELVDHIILNHHDYLRTELPRISFLIEKTAATHGDFHPELGRVNEVFAGLRVEFEQHMEREESLAFPLCKEAGRSTGGARASGAALHDVVSNMEAEHDRCARALALLRGLTRGYAPPPDACPIYRVMLDSLADLEADCHWHIHKENNLLFPRALAQVAGAAA